jgi:hypothetical protein
MSINETIDRFLNEASGRFSKFTDEWYDDVIDDAGSDIKQAKNYLKLFTLVKSKTDNPTESDVDKLIKIAGELDVDIHITDKIIAQATAVKKNVFKHEFINQYGSHTAASELFRSLKQALKQAK